MLDSRGTAVDDIREQLWQIYRDMKADKLNPTASQAEDIKCDTFSSLKKTCLKHKQCIGIILRIGSWAETPFRHRLI
ncbi:MAG: hypothetical protein K9L60_10585 [Methylovulum sp.]|nr:hypothetical protein [Methylovulum sp.]MCF7999546.1 hypothetical protein [Methylovulum sp.]